MRNFFLSALVSTMILTGSAAFANEPVLDVNPRQNPNLAEAQSLCRQAYDRIVRAQQGNEWDSDGHAQNAKELLEQVNNELKLAAEAANKNK
jgi:hypothetical protein